MLHDGEESPLPSHNRSPRVTTGDDVSIKEIYPHKPAQSDRHSETSKSPDSSVTVNKLSSNPAGESDASPAVSSNTVDSSNAETAIPSSVESKPESDADSSSQPLHRVHAGLFADKANADALSAKLASAGFAPAVHHIERDGRQLYVVQLGAFRSRENAEELAKSLRDSGFEATVTVDK
ncbi:MAG: SPOR domain-containing protein [Armatimonadota bacterium]